MGSIIEPPAGIRTARNLMRKHEGSTTPRPSPRAASQAVTSQTSESVRVMIIDDSRLFTRALTLTLERLDGIELVGSSLDGKAALGAIARWNPTVALVDLRIPTIPGIEVIRTISGRFPSVSTIALTVSDDEHDLNNVIQAGARGYILKYTAHEDVHRAILAAVRGEIWLSPRMAAKLVNLYRSHPMAGVLDQALEHPQLTRRERTVLAQLAQGLRNAEIGQLLGVAETTVKSHVKCIYEKLGVRNRAEAVALAWSYGISDQADRQSLL